MTIAYLKLIPEGGGAVRAALFETARGGEPLAFRFTRSAASDGGAVRETIDALIRAAASPPAVALALADEAPESESAPPSAPFGTPPMRPIAPDDSPESRAMLNEIALGEDPSEPFRRAASCLELAFADPAVRGMMEMGGFGVVATLYPPADAPRAAASPATNGVADRAAPYAPSPPSASPPSPHASPSVNPPGVGRSLSERMWALLAPPVPALETSPRSHRNGANRSDGETRVPDPPGYAPDAIFEKLMPFQKHGVGALLDMKRLLLADDMGLGKTVQAISALRVLRRRGEVESCLVVAPAGLLDQWRRELSRWAPELSAIIIRGTARDRAWQWRARVDAAIVSYDTLLSDLAAGERSIAARKTWDVVVADEAQRVKNRESAASQALKTLRRNRAWALTGTPIENREEELASILEFVDNDGGAPRQRRFHPGPELIERHRELQLRRKKSDVLDDLPPKMTTVQRIELTAAQRAAYDRAENEGVVKLRAMGEEITIQHVFELISRLKQICNFDPETGESAKMDDVAERLDELTARGHRALVFSQYVNPRAGVAAIADRLRRFAPLTFTGELTPEERTAVINRFKARAEHKALIMSLRAGGLGLNLQEASYVFHVDRWWNPAAERQAEDRAHRMGQTAKVTVIKYSCANTIESRIDDILERKQALFDDLIDDVSLDISQRLNQSELYGLFGL